MEQSSNTHNLELIIKNLINGIKPVDITINQFLELVSMESEYSINWKSVNFGDTMLYLFSNEWNLVNKLPVSKTESQNYITKYFNNIIIDSEFNVIMYGGPKVYDSNRDKITLEIINQFLGNDKSLIYKAYEGTSINAFYFGNQWNFSTKKMFNMFESKFGSQKTHGDMFIDIVDIEKLKVLMNQNYTYHFVLIHPQNTHLTNINKPSIMLVSVRDRNNSFNFVQKQNYQNILTINGIIEPEETSVETINNEDLNIQGLIINYNDFIFRIYTKLYGKTLADNPRFNTKQEEYIYKYQQNKLTEQNSEKQKIIAAFNYVAILLHRTLNHFTKFAKNLTEKEKKEHPTFTFIQQNEEDFYMLEGHNALIRNMCKLQRLLFSVKSINEVNYEQVKHHLKYYCSPQDIYSMYLSFANNEDLRKLVGYKNLSNQVAKNVFDFNKL